MVAEPLVPFLSVEEMQGAAPLGTSWLWEDLLAPGHVTLLTAQWKAGKTTLLSVLLAKLGTGGELAGRRVAPARAIVISEEGPAHWLRRARSLEFGRHVRWACQPFLRRPRPEQWAGLIEQLAERCAGPEPLLVVIDPLAAFLPGSENLAASMLDTLMPLRRLTALGAAVLLLHHVRKGRTLAGQAARGSGALSGHVDIEIAMNGPPADDPSERRRRLQVFSRFGLRACAIELNADGTDYALCEAEPVDEPLALGWEQVREVLDGSPHKVTRQEIIDRWPDGQRPPSDKSLWRLLNQAVSRRLVCRDGAGHKNDPHHFWLPGKVEQWLADPLGQFIYDDLEKDRERRRRGEREPAPWTRGSDEVECASGRGPIEGA